MAEEEITSKITDEHRAAIGVKSEPVTITVKEEDAKRMRTILEDNDPRWADGTGIAPPYVIAAFGGGRPGRMVQILPGALLTQQEWKFSRPIKIGEQLQATTSVFDIRDRIGGRYGYTVLVTNSTDYVDAEGNHVASALVTISQFDPSAAKDR
jgi:hypothetical protein